MNRYDGACALNVRAETLSAWRSGLLDGAEAERLTAHVPGCAACQRTVAGFERIAQALRTLPDPPRRGLWEALQDGIARRRRDAKTRRRARARFIFDIAALLILALLVAVIFSNLPLPRGHGEFPTSTPSATATRPAPTATSWVPASAGWVASPLTYGKAIAFAASAPLTGYACGNMATDPADTTTPILLGVTHDGGQTWQPAITTPALGVECHVYVNPQEPYDLLIMTGGATPSYRSRDSGQTWTKIVLPGGSDQYPIDPVWIGDTLYVLEQTYVPPVTPGP
ncbi:MAG TPA: hypothetical protein VJN88_06280, partial [Ktedonobacterales bacterium]|nr:hypothetical protein [Ktedonobacterales bacterium]